MIERRRLLHNPKEKRLYLYKAGDECTNVSGGWDFINFRSGSSVSSGIIGYKGLDNLEIKIKNTTYADWRKRGFATVNNFNLSGYNTMHIEVEDSDPANGKVFYLCIAHNKTDKLNQPYPENYAVGKGVEPGGTPMRVWDVDITKYNNNYYFIFLGATGYGTNPRGESFCKLKYVWFE